MPTTPTTSPLDPGGLAKTVTAQVSTALVAQARALVVARQQDAAAYVEDPVLAVQTRDGQEELGRDVAFYLNRVLPDVAGRLADASSAASFMAALAATAASDEGRQAPGELLDAALAQVGQFRSGASDLAETLADTAGRAAERATTLESALQQQIDALRGSDGEIQKTKDAIVETRDAIEQDLKDVVKAADEVGSGVKSWLLDKVKVVTGILSSFGGGDGEEDGATKDTAPPTTKKKKKTKASDADNGKGTSTKAKAGTGTDDDEDGEDRDEDGTGSGAAPKPKPGKKFDVSGLDVDVDRSGDDGTGGTSQGAAELGSAAAAFREHNATLAALYQTLARQKAELAVAAAISDQAAGFASSLTSAASAAAALTDAWQTLLDAATALQDESEPEQMARNLATAATGAAAHWASLSAQTDYARSAMAGKSGAIPDVGVLPAAGGK